MKSTAFALLLPALATTLGFAQDSESILYVPSGVTWTASGSGGTILGRILERTVGSVTPLAGGGYSSEKFVPFQTWLNMRGDDDGDANYFDVIPDIDALEVRNLGASTTPHDLIISPRAGWRGTVCAPVLAAGSVGRVLGNGMNGCISHELGLGQVRAALGLPAGTPVNIDAFAIDPLHGHRLLSFAGVVAATLAYGGGLAAIMIQPDDVVVIAGGPIAPNSAMIARYGYEMNAFVTNSGIRDHTNAAVTTVVNVTALETRASNRWTLEWGPQQGQGGNPIVFVDLPHFAFAAQTLTGCGICTTEAGGQILAVNAVPMGESAAATTGAHLGLAANAAYLQGLAMGDAEPRRFTLGSPNPEVPVGSAMTIEIGLDDPAALPVLFLGFAVAGVGNVDMSVVPPFAVVAFPELYPAALAIPLGLVAAPLGGGFHRLTVPAWPMAGDFLWQSAAISAGQIALSSPARTRVF